MSSNYRYENIPLFPNIFGEIARELYSGKMVKRDELAEAVRDHHISQGGKEPNASLLDVAKKALNALQRNQLASKTGAYGLWWIHGDTVLSVDSADAVESLTSIETVPPAREVVGAGNEIVYAFTYPLYEQHASEAKRDRYQVKIGRSQSTSLTRVTDQTGTALPEYPMVLIVIRCDDSALLERAIHSTLELRGLAIDDAPGNEWFSTNPDEIQEIWHFTMPASEERSTD